jgi:hypothetical protein
MIEGRAQLRRHNLRLSSNFQMILNIRIVLSTMRFQ